MQKLLLTFIIAVCSLNIYSQDDTVSVMYYNILNFPNDNPSKITELKNISQYLLPDVLMVGELITSAGADDILTDALNENGITYYEKATFINGDDTDNMLYYNGDKLEFYSQDTIETSLRLINHYTLFAKDPNLALHNDTIFLNFYVVHLKASQGGSNQTQRHNEVTAMMNYINNTGGWENVFVVGDFNIYTSTEPAYQAMVNAVGNDLNDPINMPGNWHNSTSFASIHTQSTRTTQVGSGSSGGMDDRFDQILISDDLVGGTDNVNYIPNTYDAFGNDGLHYNTDINAAPAQVGIPASIIDDLYIMSDHLPVLASFNIDYPEAPISCNPPSNHYTNLITPSSCRLQWASEPLATTYQIRGRAAGSTSYVYLPITYTSPNFLNVNGLANNVTYEWEIQSICDTASSAWTGLTPFTTACYEPDTTATTNVSATSAVLNWLPVAGADRYELRGRLLGTSSFVTIFINGGTKSKLNVSGLNPSTSYEWEVKTWCDFFGNNRSAYTGLTAFTTNSMKFENHSLSEDELNVYPNPASDVIHVKLMPEIQLINSVLKIEDVTGRVLIEMQVLQHEFRINVSDLSAGMYRVVLPGNNFRWISVN